MDRKDTYIITEVMIAYAEGKQVQRLIFENLYDQIGEWICDDYPSWNWEVDLWRIKPQKNT